MHPKQALKEQPDQGAHNLSEPNCPYLQVDLVLGLCIKGTDQLLHYQRLKSKHLNMLILIGNNLRTNMASFKSFEYK